MFYVLLAATIAFILGLYFLLPSDQEIIESYEENALLETEVNLDEKGGFIDEESSMHDKSGKENSLRGLLCNFRFLTLLFAGFVVGYCISPSFSS
jgi:hypothetical protein